MVITEETMKDGKKKITSTITKTTLENIISNETSFKILTIMLNPEKSGALAKVVLPSDVIELLNKKNK
jgi:ribosomal protein S7